MVLFYIIIFFMIIDLYYKSKKSLHMLQQNLYNENNRYLKWVSKNTFLFLDFEVVALIFMAIGLFVIYDLNLYSLCAKIIILLVYIFEIFKWKNHLSNEQTKKPLVITKRVKRLLVTMTILYLIPICLLIFNNKGVEYNWLFMLVFGLMVYFNFIVVWICKVINTPIEKCVNIYYKTKAKRKLKSMSNLKVVGITGSYGKTSSKNILADILNIKYNTLPTPKNLNTPYGLMITINNHLDKFTDIFIAEMGAYVCGEIKELCDFVKPKYGILTRIGTAHLESFGSEENIQKTKFELIESLPSDGIGVLNKDDPKQVSYKLKNKVEILWIGIDNKDVDVWATNIKCSNKGTSFDVIFKNDSKKYPFTTKLLGVHNVYNILAGLALGRKFGIDISDLQASVKTVKPIEHRLELKRLGNFYMIDDAYNSNPVGAKNAVEVLSMMPGVKVIVTPGMIELGEKEDELNEKFGEEIAELSKADYVVLIGEEKTKPILKGLKNKGYSEDKIVVYNDVKEAYNFIGGLTNGKKDVYALFENDLPDTYNE